MLKKNNGKGSILKTTIILFSCLLVNSFVSANEKTVDAVPVDVVIETKFGDMVLKLFPDVAPGHVENFLKLAKSGFYDGTIFHRVIPGFMIQGGDPNSKGSDKSTHGTGGPGYAIDAEFNDKPHVRGTLSMARSRDPDSAGSQFFIVVKESSFLDHQYTVFGVVVNGIEVADEIVSQERDARDNPMERIEVKIRVIELENEMTEGGK
ncbi:MAG: peptidylprolyl isomerase [Proteobacteria bacterium]|nr:peptidylprolyl isomerase [Pseudomonadota bacterium]